MIIICTTKSIDFIFNLNDDFSDSQKLYFFKKIIRYFSFIDV